MMIHNPLCVALDHDDRTELLNTARAVAPHAGVLKIGLTPYTALGPDLVRAVTEIAPVFLDLKLHDIPAQVEGAARAASSLGVSFLTIHAAGGAAMVKAAVGAVESGTVVLAVTVLTSLDDSDLAAVGLEGPADKAVVRLAELAVAAGAGGLVCSPLEVTALRARFGPSAEGGPILVVPGIRPAGSELGDQRRTLGPRQALTAGADLIVVGRPITGAADPVEAARAISAEAMA
ncbi:MAG: orotidine-5-phosphate decarboxylase [Actinomycetota bacterium]|jgi:orotidine-5'-phosphate decarboxylase|nr:orotidine-5-phosphate decarboxylase [Actinomycetota bacterium]